MQMRDPSPHPAVILFDGECHFCLAWVGFVLRHDSRGAFRFAPLLSDAARRLLVPFGLRPDALDSIALIAGPTLATRSDAIVQICSQLRFPWRLVSWLVLIPRPLRDVMYMWMARNRHRLFCQRDRRRMADPEVDHRFLR
jgi:predicted DCC family thiol-disulfide oxidoreductase YuxK